MPTVPTYDNMRVQQNTLPDARFAGPDISPEDIAGKQLQGMGQAMESTGQRFGSIAADIQQRADVTAASAADVQATLRLTALQTDPQQGFVTLRGQRASQQLPDYVQKAQQIRSDAIASAPNPAARDMVDRVVSARVQSAIQAMSGHAAQQYAQFQVDTSQSRAQVSILASAADPTNEPAFQSNLGTAIIEADTQAHLQGWDDATRQLQRQKYTDQAYAQRYEAWRTADPVGALASFQANANAISPVARVQLYHQLFEASAPLLAQQVNATGGPGVVTDRPDAGQLPRGVRNNNPGNLTKGSTPWDGEVQGTDPRFASFATPEAGIAAMGKQLLAYQDNHGLDTVQAIVSRWAPATENNTPGYVKAVSDAMGVKPGESIDLHDPKTLATLSKAMIQVENGQQPYSEQQISLGLAAAQPGAAPLPAPATGAAAPATALAWRDPSVPTGNALVDGLPGDWKLHVLQLARSQAQQDMAGAREALRKKVQDASASYLVNGFAPNPPTLAEFMQAYGQGEGQAQYASFQNTARLGQQLQQVKTLPQAQLDTLLQQAKPAPGPGFADAQHNYALLVKATDQVVQQRLQDPMQYAIESQAYGLQPLNINNTAAMAQELSRRAAASSRISSDYGTPVALLTKDEARALSDGLKAAPVETQKQVLGAIAQATGATGQQADVSAFRSSMQAIAPDQPVLALAGLYQARGLTTDQGRNVSDLLLRGQAILTPNKKTDGTGHDGGASLLKMPDEATLLSDFNSTTGDAFAGREQARDLFVQASRAIYAAKSAEEGDYSGSYNSARWKAAIQLATGGIQSHNGSNIVLPYGMGYDVFQNALKARVDQLAPSVKAASPAEMMSLPLENVSDGRYLFRRGAGYLVDKNGAPVVATITPPAPAPSAQGRPSVSPRSTAPAPVGEPAYGFIPTI